MGCGVGAAPRPKSGVEVCLECSIPTLYAGLFESFLSTMGSGFTTEQVVDASIGPGCVGCCAFEAVSSEAAQADRAIRESFEFADNEYVLTVDPVRVLDHIGNFSLALSACATLARGSGATFTVDRKRITSDSLNGLALGVVWFLKQYAETIIVDSRELPFLLGSRAPYHYHPDLQIFTRTEGGKMHRVKKSYVVRRCYVPVYGTFGEEVTEGVVFGTPLPHHEPALIGRSPSRRQPRFWRPEPLAAIVIQESDSDSGTHSTPMTRCDAFSISDFDYSQVYFNESRVSGVYLKDDECLFSRDEVSQISLALHDLHIPVSVDGWKVTLVHSCDKYTQERVGDFLHVFRYDSVKRTCGCRYWCRLETDRAYFSQSFVVDVFFHDTKGARTTAVAEEPPAPPATAVSAIAVPPPAPLAPVTPGQGVQIQQQWGVGGYFSLLIHKSYNNTTTRAVVKLAKRVSSWSGKRVNDALDKVAASAGGFSFRCMCVYFLTQIESFLDEGRRFRVGRIPRYLALHGDFSPRAVFRLVIEAATNMLGFKVILPPCCNIWTLISCCMHVITLSCRENRDAKFVKFLLALLPSQGVVLVTRTVSTGMNTVLSFFRTHFPSLFQSSLQQTGQIVYKLRQAGICTSDELRFIDGCFNHCGAEYNSVSRVTGRIGFEYVYNGVDMGNGPKPGDRVWSENRRFDTKVGYEFVGQAYERDVRKSEERIIEDVALPVMFLCAAKFAYHRQNRGKFFHEASTWKLPCPPEMEDELRSYGVDVRPFSEGTFDEDVWQDFKTEYDILKSHKKVRAQIHYLVKDLLLHERGLVPLFDWEWTKKFEVPAGKVCKGDYTSERSRSKGSKQVQFFQRSSAGPQSGDQVDKRALAEEEARIRAEEEEFDRDAAARQAELDRNVKFAPAEDGDFVAGKDHKRDREREDRDMDDAIADMMDKGHYRAPRPIDVSDDEYISEKCIPCPAELWNEAIFVGSQRAAPSNGIFEIVKGLQHEACAIVTPNFLIIPSDYISTRKEDLLNPATYDGEFITCVNGKKSYQNIPLEWRSLRIVLQSDPRGECAGVLIFAISQRGMELLGVEEYVRTPIAKSGNLITCIESKSELSTHGQLLCKWDGEVRSGSITHSNFAGVTAGALVPHNVGTVPGWCGSAVVANGISIGVHVLGGATQNGWMKLPTEDEIKNGNIIIDNPSLSIQSRRMFNDPKPEGLATAKNSQSCSTESSLACVASQHALGQSGSSTAKSKQETSGTTPNDPSIVPLAKMGLVEDKLYQMIVQEVMSRSSPGFVEAVSSQMASHPTQVTTPPASGSSSVSASARRRRRKNAQQSNAGVNSSASSPPSV